jgi:hypothetical protein
MGRSYGLGYVPGFLLKEIVEVGRIFKTKGIGDF